MNGVTLRDYEGMTGFGSSSQGEVDELNKALSAGYQNPPLSGGSALRVESLEATLRVLTFSQQHIQLWRNIPKQAAYSTVEEYNVQTSYGGESGPFVREGELPQTQDASYERKTALVKFLGTQGEVTHPMTLVKPAHGNVIALETQNRAIWLLERLERQLFDGRSDVIPEAFDGLFKQITDDSVAAAQNVLDMRNGPITEDSLEEGANLIVEAYGIPQALYLAPRAKSDVSKQFYPRERTNLPAPVQGKVGISVNSFESSAGEVVFRPDIFLRSGKNNGVKSAPSSATAARSPSAPTLAGANVAGPITGSRFLAADIGNFIYQASAINRFGESAAGTSAAVAINAAGDAVDVTITDGGGSDGATGYNLFRTAVGGAAATAQFITQVPRVGAAATTVFRDLNLALPGTSKAYMIQDNTQFYSFRQLAPMIKIPLATIAASIRWMQLLYGVPIIYSPRRAVIYTNILDD